MTDQGEGDVRPRVLVADTPAGASMIGSLLSDAFELSYAHSLEEAAPLLSSRLSAIVCGLHFDGSRMFDLLRMAKASGARKVRFICYRDLESDLGASVIEGLEIASSVMGATAFVDSYTLKYRYGIEHADDVLRSYIVHGLWAAPLRPVKLTEPAKPPP